MLSIKYAFFNVIKKKKGIPHFVKCSLLPIVIVPTPLKDQKTIWDKIIQFYSLPNNGQIKYIVHIGTFIAISKVVIKLNTNRHNLTIYYLLSVFFVSSVYNKIKKIIHVQTEL